MTSAKPKASAADAIAALASAGPSHWTILEAGAGIVQETVDASNPQGAINGNVGVTEHGKFQSSGPRINGDLYLGTSAIAQFSGTYPSNKPVSGTVFLSTGASVGPGSYSFTKVTGNYQPMLAQARTDAMNASSVASGLTPTSALTQINLSHINLTLNPGVYNLTKFSLDHATLTLSGSGDYVFNISSTFKLSSGKVLVANGAAASNILFNYTGTQDVAFSGGTGGTNPGGPDESVLHGVILAMNANVNLAPGLVVGEIISGKNISVVSGAIVNQPPPPSVPDSGSTLALALISLAAVISVERFVLRRRRILSRASRN